MINISEEFLESLKHNTPAYLAAKALLAQFAAENHVRDSAPMRSITTMLAAKFGASSVTSVTVKLSDGRDVQVSFKKPQRILPDHLLDGLSQAEKEYDEYVGKHGSDDPH